MRNYLAHCFKCLPVYFLVLTTFSSGFQDFHIDPVDRYVPPDFIMEQGFYFSNPVKHSMDGAFAARLVRAL